MNDAEIRRIIDEEYRAYRQSGLGLAALLVTLAAVMAGWSVSLPLGVQAHHLRLVLCQLLFLGAGVTLSVGVQFFHYIGYQKQARRYFLSHEETPAALQRSANRHFRIADQLVVAALVAIGLGVGISLVLWYGVVRGTATAMPNAS